MKTFTVTLPIAGHAIIEVEAEDAAAAKELAFASVTMTDIESWEALDAFNSGNVCYCPSPWEMQIEEHKSDDAA